MPGQNRRPDIPLHAGIGEFPEQRYLSASPTARCVLAENNKNLRRPHVRKMLKIKMLCDFLAIGHEWAAMDILAGDCQTYEFLEKKSCRQNPFTLTGGRAFGC